ncbi:Mov34/MPN/PAD-1 family protein [Methylobacterium sp. J-077]|uniref:Mov34/MPN/PAD-1 family protein n=1 Tax=Methylobacterium sp. J-077 TaxID=2836656 RepID=UPI001FBA890F|nr:Mov34/MPN/PAD-1 family protein [Methylobacterium sp. J-077]MCJ2124574.1 Mov34/MPN/PAD-1 family protein [Methylobacterium sp. J-077]
MNALTLQTGKIRVRITAEALTTFAGHRQKRCYHREAGGQLFGSIRPSIWTVLEATGPRKGDRRGRYGFWPDRASEQRDIHSFHARGLEYLGDWHTHPEDRPTPSGKDMTSIASIVRESTHHLPGFLLCIVGRLSFPDGLWLSLHTRRGEATRGIVTEPVPSGSVPAMHAARQDGRSPRP